MKWLLVALMGIHGLIHFMGPAKAFGVAELPQLTQPISRGVGLAWLAAAVAMLVAAALVVWAPRVWWIAGFVAVALSQTVIVTSWSDAKVGTLANLVVLAAALYGLASEGPTSFRSEYRREVGARLDASGTAGSFVAETDLDRLPDPVRRYVRKAGVVGQPRVRHFRVTMRGRIREGASDPWMEFTARQHNFIEEPARFFLMDATKGGLPVDVLHAYRGGEASMRVRLLSVFPVVDVSGPDLDRAETVTLFNDLCLMAPGALVDSRIRWEPVDERSARGYFTVGSNTVSAVLHFNEGDELVDFVSDDRFAAASGGEELVRQRWSTPVSTYGRFGPLRLMTLGEGRWHPPEGVFTYFQAELIDVEMNGDAPWS